MFKIDIHTHILPENLNEITSTFSDHRFIKIDPINDLSVMLKKEDIAFRKVDCNCWNHKVRMQECDDIQVDIQVLSTIPVLFSYWANDDECLTLSQFLNDHIAQICREEPQRFIGLGTIPMQNTKMAISEMDRCINELNLPGIEIGSNVNGENLSDEKFHPVFEHAEKLGCSIFIHPWDIMGKEEMEKYWLPWLVGMPAETSRAICSMIFGGVFERLPNLRVAFAHGGGSFPATVGRIQQGYDARPDLCAIDNQVDPQKYLGKFWVDSLVHDADALDFLIKKIGADKIALGTDYPFPLGELKPGNLIESMDYNNEQKEKLFFQNALDWLGLPANHFS